jgi:hypothetical protein
MRKIIIQNLAFALILGVLLFLPAGDLAWPQGWAFEVDPVVWTGIGLG